MNLTLDNIKSVYCGRTPQPMGRHRFFSVLVPIVEKDGVLNLLFEVRSKSLKADPGEICFPGGHVEPGEDPCSCALRETAEETGIPESAIELIGAGDVLYGYANYTMYSYLGIISFEDYLASKPAAAEVDELFLVPVERFVAAEPLIYNETVQPEIQDDFPFAMLGIDRDYKWRVGKWPIPIYDIDGRMIWGLTARITQNVINTLRDSKSETPAEGEGR